MHLYYAETQSNILIIVIFLQPELENDISTMALAGQKSPELQQVSAPWVHLPTSYSPFCHPPSTGGQLKLLVTQTLANRLGDGLEKLHVGIQYGF